jgi:hypothetical protein
VANDAVVVGGRHRDGCLEYEEEGRGRLGGGVSSGFGRFLAPNDRVVTVVKLTIKPRHT